LRGRSNNHGPSQRQLKVGEQVRHVLAEALLRGELRDPRIDGSRLTVTEVRVSPDLKNGKVFVSELGKDDVDPSALAALTGASAYLAGRLARELNLKYAPRLRFEPDTTFKSVAKLERLLDEGLGSRRSRDTD